ncbi:uncharacterized protein EAF01_005258 [Botrytis porri]|uniref:uncharacterized protein n=1 Tax=Botrytis porri TaxID=87229 RepID=UPI0018FFD754|nr:uncharacterized protein EAF01_005258 [Botrytis porri]KAF7907672.1 hypothetical protein EAF01_005258 [Botrytis porri]
MVRWKGRDIDHENGGDAEDYLLWTIDTWNYLLERPVKIIEVCFLCWTGISSNLDFKGNQGGCKCILLYEGFGVLTIESKADYFSRKATSIKKKCDWYCRCWKCIVQILLKIWNCGRKWLLCERTIKLKYYNQIARQQQGPTTTTLAEPIAVRESQGFQRQVFL